jgi:hypothetical protein
VTTYGPAWLAIIVAAAVVMIVRELHRERRDP